MSWGSQNSAEGQRGVSTAVGPALLVATVVVVSVTTLTLLSSLSQVELEKTDPQNIGRYGLELESDGGNTLAIRSCDGPDGNMPTSDPDISEPTDDVFLLFKPGCTERTFKLGSEGTGYDTDVYLNGTKIIDNVNTATTGTVFSAPGVKCRGDTTRD